MPGPQSNSTTKSHQIVAILVILGHVLAACAAVAIALSSVSLQEMQASALDRFGTADTDGDGFLSGAELEAHAKAVAARRSQRMLKRMDVNLDGKLSLREMQGHRDPARIFERMDVDNSGTLSRKEFEEARARIKRHLKIHPLKD